MGWMIKKPPEAMGRMGISTGVCVCVCIRLDRDASFIYFIFPALWRYN